MLRNRLILVRKKWRFFFLFVEVNIRMVIKSVFVISSARKSPIVSVAEVSSVLFIALIDVFFRLLNFG